MKPLCLILFSFFFVSCQHQNSRMIGYDQLQLYTQQKESSVTWTSKARAQALGVPNPASRILTAKPFFGLSFNEAKGLIRILDIRSKVQFAQKNLDQKTGTQSPVINIPWTELEKLSPEGLKSRLQSSDITTEKIIILLSNPLSDGQSALQLLVSNGYERTLYYEYAY